MNQPQLPKELVAGSTVCRDLQIDTRAAVIDQEKRTVELAFSSETPVERWYGNEVLDHGPKAVRLGRMKQGGALLMDHNTSDQVGVVESVRIDADRTGRAVMRFGKSARAQEIFQDVVDGIRKNVSVGYRVLAAVLESSKDGVETYRITDWEPYEISLVSVPADATVGVGRSAEEAPTPKPEPEIRTMSEENKKTRPSSTVPRRAAARRRRRAQARRRHPRHRRPVRRQVPRRPRARRRRDAQQAERRRVPRPGAGEARLRAEADRRSRHDRQGSEALQHRARAQCAGQSQAMPRRTKTPRSSASAPKPPPSAAARRRRACWCRSTCSSAA
jgi:HK97 family phage prohead protease